MKKRRRTVGIFGLSFLDVMFCGFGSVILLVMIVNAETVERREKVHTDLRAEVSQLERTVLEGRRRAAALRSALAETEEAMLNSERLSRSTLEAIEAVRPELADLDAQTLAKTAHVDALKSDLITLDESTNRLSAQAEQASRDGTKARRFQGEGERQYLTGLKVGGKRILILVDVSASMLAETVVNVVRLRNMAESRRRSARKWQHALVTVEWLSSQLPVDADYQIYTFNTRAGSVLEGMDGRWLPAANAETLDLAIEKLRGVTPADGTSLHRAFDALTDLSPRPDNVILLTDGLPTQGNTKPRGNTTSGKDRLKYFNSAVSGLSKQVPINVILFPMEGDPFAAAEFWKLAAITQGSFMTPSKDWP